MKQLLLAFALLFSTAVFAQREYTNQFESGVTVYRSQTGEAIMVYPNPATEFITLNDNDLVDRLVLINLVGKRVRNFNYRKGDVYNVEELPQGLYLLQLIDKNSRVISSTRINKR